MPHTEVHGTVTGTDDGKHAKADTELGEIALKNKLFFLLLRTLCHVCGVSRRIIKFFWSRRGEQKEKGSNSCENVALSRSMAGNIRMMYPVSHPTQPQEPEHTMDVLQISVGSVRRSWYICVTMACLLEGRQPNYSRDRAFSAGSP